MLKIETRGRGIRKGPAKEGYLHNENGGQNR
jgi:hypothetical protein